MGALGNRRVEVRDSPVHGRGVFARVGLTPGDRVGWYRGEVITSDEADARHEAAGSPAHTMLFTRSDGLVIDGAHGGNHTRFINHGCAPNCHAEEHEDGRIEIVASGEVPAGAEVFIDYQLQIDPDADPSLYECRCASVQCRGTMAEQATAQR